VTYDAEYDRLYRRDKIMGRSRTCDAQSVVLHVNSLLGQGWREADIARVSGVDKAHVRRVARAMPRRVRLDTAQALLGVQGESPIYVYRYKVLRRIRALMAMGWPHSILTEQMGFDTRSFAHNSALHTSRERLDASRRVYRELSAREGPSSFTRLAAQRQGYPSPAQWDDIDNDEAPEEAA